MRVYDPAFKPGCKKNYVSVLNVCRILFFYVNIFYIYINTPNYQVKTVTYELENYLSIIRFRIDNGFRHRITHSRKNRTCILGGNFYLLCLGYC